MTTREKAALDAVDLPRLIELLSEMVAIRSVGAAESPAQLYMGAQLRALGMETDEWDIDLATLAHDPDYSTEVDRTEAIGLVGVWSEGEPLLMLNGHIDVVPVGDEAQWSSPPWRLTESNRHLYGRGAADMKGGLACALAAVHALRTAGLAPSAGVLVTSVIGEEDGGLGTLATLTRGHAAAAAVVLEPTAGAIAPSQAGALGFRLTVPGMAAHGSMRTEGVSAIEKFELVHRALRALEADRNAIFDDPLYSDYDVPLAISIGRLRAGEWSSTVPDTLVCEGRYGVGPREDVARARTILERTVGDAAAGDPWLAEHPPHVEWWGGQFHPAATDPSSTIIDRVAACHRTVTGSEPLRRGVPYGSDLRHLVNRGAIPTVLYGPGDARVAHRADEHVPIDDLQRTTEALVLLMLRLGSAA